jgi:hypothetical protein
VWWHSYAGDIGKRIVVQGHSQVRNEGLYPKITKEEEEKGLEPGSSGRAPV